MWRDKERIYGRKNNLFVSRLTTIEGNGQKENRGSGPPEEAKANGRRLQQRNVKKRRRDQRQEKEREGRRTGEIVQTQHLSSTRCKGTKPARRLMGDEPPGRRYWVLPSPTPFTFYYASILSNRAHSSCTCKIQRLPVCVHLNFSSLEGPIFSRHAETANYRGNFQDFWLGLSLGSSLDWDYSILLAGLVSTTLFRHPFQTSIAIIALVKSCPSLPRGVAPVVNSMLYCPVTSPGTTTLSRTNQSLDG